MRQVQVTFYESYVDYFLSDRVVIKMSKPKKIALLTIFESLIIIVSTAKNYMVAANGINYSKHCVCPVSAHPNRNKK